MTDYPDSTESEPVFKTLESIQVITYNDEFYEVRWITGIGQLDQKTFKGESAWSDAERYANDLLTAQRRSPFGERFAL